MCMLSPLESFDSPLHTQIYIYIYIHARERERDRERERVLLVKDLPLKKMPR